ncbi:MAG: hypothetical protein ACE5LU_15095 [Anaerolineae bacterium]
MAALTLELPPALLRRLERYAAERGVEPQDIAREILERELGDGAEEQAPQTERARIRKALREAGLTRSVGQRLVDKYVQVMNPMERAAMRQRLQRKQFKPLLSEIIIEDRGIH